MSGNETGPGEMKLAKTGIKTRIVPFEESDPATEPLFINYAHVAFVAGSAYIDVGVVTLETIASAEEVAEFAVLNRLVMSKETLVLFRDQINDLLGRAETVNAAKE
jgi:hypothetical protein